MKRGFVSLLGIVALLGTLGCAGKRLPEVIEDAAPDNKVLFLLTFPVYMPLAIAATLIDPGPNAKHVGACGQYDTMHSCMEKMDRARQRELAAEEGEQARKARLVAYSEKVERGEPIMVFAQSRCPSGDSGCTTDNYGQRMGDIIGGETREFMGRDSTYQSGTRATRERANGVRGILERCVECSMDAAKDAGEKCPSGNSA